MYLNWKMVKLGVHIIHTNAIKREDSKSEKTQSNIEFRYKERCTKLK